MPLESALAQSPLKKGAGAVSPLSSTAALTRIESVMGGSLAIRARPAIDSPRRAVLYFLHSIFEGKIMSEAAVQNSETPKTWWQGDAFFIIAIVAATLVIAYGMARYEVVSRPKKAYLEGEKYYGWYKNPADKKTFYDAELAAKRVDQDTYARLM